MPAVVGSLLVQSANLLAGFLFAQLRAFFAICTQILPNLPGSAGRGQQLA
jgi:hypothetical protein